MSYYNEKKMSILKKILLTVTIAHSVIAIVYWLVWPTLQRVYFGVPQFWLEFDTGRGFSLVVYLFFAFITGLIASLTAAGEL